MTQHEQAVNYLTNLIDDNADLMGRYSPEGYKTAVFEVKEFFDRNYIRKELKANNIKFEIIKNVVYCITIDLDNVKVYLRTRKINSIK